MARRGGWAKVFLIRMSNRPIFFSLQASVRNMLLTGSKWKVIMD